jgi:hypothetical protein
MKISVQLPEGQLARQASLQEKLEGRWGFQVEVTLVADLRDSQGQPLLEHLRIDFSPGGEAWDVLARIKVYNLVRNIVRASRPVGKEAST